MACFGDQCFADHGVRWVAQFPTSIDGDKKSGERNKAQNYKWNALIRVACVSLL